LKNQRFLIIPKLSSLTCGKKGGGGKRKEPVKKERSVSSQQQSEIPSKPSNESEPGKEGKNRRRGRNSWEGEKRLASRAVGKKEELRHKHARKPRNRSNDPVRMKKEEEERVWKGKKRGKPENDDLKGFSRAASGNGAYIGTNYHILSGRKGRKKKPSLSGRKKGGVIPSKRVL